MLFIRLLTECNCIRFIPFISRWKVGSIQPFSFSLNDAKKTLTVKCGCSRIAQSSVILPCKLNNEVEGLQEKGRFKFLIKKLSEYFIWVHVCLKYLVALHKKVSCCIMGGFGALFFSGIFRLLRVKNTAQILLFYLIFLKLAKLCAAFSVPFSRAYMLCAVHHSEHLNANVYYFLFVKVMEIFLFHFLTCLLTFIVKFCGINELRRRYIDVRMVLMEQSISLIFCLREVRCMKKHPCEKKKLFFSSLV